MQITIRDIARYCGVSIGTVDRALNNRQGISQKTKDRVLQMTKKLNYTPNHLGRNLVKGRTMTIGIVCFDLNNNFFSEIIDTIEADAKKRGYFINLILTHRVLKNEMEGIQYLFERRVDGIILFPIGIGEEYIGYLKRLDIPIVTIYNKIADDFVHVGVNDVCVMRQAVEFLVQKKYEEIIYLTPPIDEPEAAGKNVYLLKQRLLGYLEGIEKMKVIRGPVVLQDKLFSAGLEKIRFHDGTRKAILCSSDIYALEAMNYFDRIGLNIPKDIGIMGYDNLDILKYIKPKLTTVEYSVKKMGSMVFNLLYDSMHGNDVLKEYLLDYTFVDGETV